MNSFFVCFHYFNGFEHLFTLTALERLLSCMIPYMYLQLIWTQKGFFTHCTNGIWFVFKLFVLKAIHFGFEFSIALLTEINFIFVCSIFVTCKGC